MKNSVREVFAAAAESYDHGNPLLQIEREETAALLPILSGQAVLDLGAGRGHYASFAHAQGAARAVALDLTPEMLAGAPRPALVADAAALPLTDGCIDVVVAALMLSYVSDRGKALSEAARVLRPGGTLVLSDLHPVATARGWRRSFEDGAGRPVIARAAPPTLVEVRRHLGDAGLTVEAQREPVVDERLRTAFHRAGRPDFAVLYGTPLLALFRARKGGSHAG